MVFTFQSGKNVSDVVNESVASVLMQNTASCLQTTDTTQVLSIKNIQTDGCALSVSDVSQQTFAMPSSKCMQQAANDANLSQMLKSTIQQKMKEEMKNLSFGDSQSSENYNRTLNEVASSVNINNVMSCVQQTLSKQLMELGDFTLKNCPTKKVVTIAKDGTRTETDEPIPVEIKNLSQTIIAQASQDCSSANQNTAKLVNQLDQILSQTTTIANDGWDPLGFLSILGIAGLLFLIVLFYGGYSLVRSDC